MAPEDRAIIRDLYRTACHGAGAGPRWEARDRLERIRDEAGLDLGLVFDAMGLDVGAYQRAEKMREGRRKPLR
jgi:hypothetical protein